MSVHPSHLVLLTSGTFYSLLLRRLTGHSPTPGQVSKAIKAISTFHSSLTTILALLFLARQSQPTPQTSRSITNGTASREPKHGYPDDSANPLIATRSTFGNSIAALEAGYLVSDIGALLLEARLHRKSKSGGMDKTLLTHHVTIGTALLVLQYYISRGREAGIHIIVMFLLMNASTPVLNLRWYLRSFKAQNKRAIVLTDVLFAASFFAARVWLVGNILTVYGKSHGWNAWEAYKWGLRTPCKMGTGALLMANLGWWVMLVLKTLGRLERVVLGGQ